MEWQLQDAKNRFSQVVKEARSSGPQIITLRGEQAVVVLSIEEFRRLQPENMSFKDYLVSGPPWDDEFVEMVNDRDTPLDRDVDF